MRELDPKAATVAQIMNDALPTATNTDAAPGSNIALPVPQPKQWEHIPGHLAMISVASKTNVWGLDATGQVWRSAGTSASPWIKVPGVLKDLDAAEDGTVWGSAGAALAGNIWRYTGIGSNPWIQITGALTQISVGSKQHVWGTNVGTVWRYTGNDAKPWTQVAASLTSISAAADGAVWGLDSGGSIWRYRIEDFS